MQLIILDVRLSSDFVSHKLQKKVALSFALSSCDQLLEVSEKFIIPPKDYENLFLHQVTLHLF